MVGTPDFAGQIRLVQPRAIDILEFDSPSHGENSCPKWSNRSETSNSSASGAPVMAQWSDCGPAIRFGRKRQREKQIFDLGKICG